MALKDVPAPEGDEQPEYISDGLSPQQLRELRDSAIANADAALHRHGTPREFIVQLDLLIEATEHFQTSLWRQV